MPGRKEWGYDPHIGGVKIPEHVKRDVETRIQRCAEKHYHGKYTRIDVRFRGQFCYIDACTDPSVPRNWPLTGISETKEEHIARRRHIPWHLCRLRYLGDDRWSLAFFLYSQMKYEPSFFSNGKPDGKPEDAFLLGAQFHLTE